jgi:hypothetical protein
MLEEGQAIVRRCLRRNLAGPYRIQAAIHTAHADATTAEHADRPQILALYDQLLALTPPGRRAQPRRAPGAALGQTAHARRNHRSAHRRTTPGVPSHGGTLITVATAVGMLTPAVWSAARPWRRLSQPHR